MVLFQIGFLTVTLIDVVDLLLVSWIFYRVYMYFKGTRAGQMLAGMIFLMLASFLFNAFGLSASSWLVNQFQTVWVVAFVILFQPELRRLLIYVGQTRFFVLELPALLLQLLKRQLNFKNVIGVG